MKSWFWAILIAPVLAAAFAAPINGEASFAMFGLGRLEGTLDRLAPYVYEDKAIVLRKAAARVRQLPVPRPGFRPIDFESAKARYFALLAVQPFLEGIETRHFSTNVLPHLRSILLPLQKKFGMESVREFALNSECVATALHLIEAGLSQTVPYLTTFEQRREAASLIAAAGRDLAKGGERASHLLAALRKDEGLLLLESLATNPRTQGSARMILALKGYLE